MSDDILAAPNEGEQTTQDHPDDMDAAPDFGENNVDLPEQLQNILRSLFQKFMKEEMYEDRGEVQVGRRLRFYERGFQHITWSDRLGMFQQVSPGMTTNVGGEQVEAPNYVDDYNIFQPYLLTRVSVLTQNPPGIDFKPKKKADTVDQQAAKDAEAYKELFDENNDRPALQMQAARYMGLSSRVTAWTRTEADAQRWGLDENGEPNQRETTSMYGDLETKCRMTARDLRDTNYFVIMTPKYILDAKAQNPEKRDKIKSGDGSEAEDVYRMFALLGVLQGPKKSLAVGDILKNIVAEFHCWLRPSSFEDECCDAAIDFEYKLQNSEPEEQGGALTCRDVLKDLFHDGAHIKFMGDVYCSSWNETMDDCLTVVWAYEGDGMSRMAFMYPCLTLQDRFNDFMNAAAEVFDYGWPSRWIEGDEADGDAIRDQRSEPFNVYTKKMKGNVTALENLFYQEPNPELPATFVEHIQFISGQLAQFILGAPPALFGGSMKASDTASAYAQARDQAMGVIGPVWMQMQRLWAGIYYQAALAAGQNPSYPEILVAPVAGGQGQQELRPQRMQKGRFGAYPDKDSGFPETEAAKRQMLQAFLTLIGQNPIALQAFLSLPSNWELVRDLMGVPGLDFVQAFQEDKERRETEELLKNSPLPPDPAVVQEAMIQHASAALAARATGQPEPPAPDPMAMMEPSVKVDAQWDFHNYAVQYWQRWIVENADKLIAEGNEQGVMNAKLHAAQHKQLAEAMAAAMAPPMPLPAPGGAAPHATPPGHGVTPPAPGASQAALG